MKNANKYCFISFSFFLHHVSPLCPLPPLMTLLPAIITLLSMSMSSLLFFFFTQSLSTCPHQRYFYCLIALVRLFTQYWIDAAGWTLFLTSGEKHCLSPLSVMSAADCFVDAIYQAKEVFFFFYSQVLIVLVIKEH